MHEITPDFTSAFQSPTFERDLSIDVPEPIGSATISPCGRDIALASKHGLHIIDLDNPFSPPRHIRHETPWTPADVQWSPFASKPYWIVNTSNQRALVWNLALSTTKAPIEFVLHAHNRAITDINFSPFHPELLATCAVDGFVHSWDLRTPARPVTSFNDWFAGASQVKWNRKDSHIVASSHDRFLRIWDDRKGAIPVTSIEAHRTKIYGVDWSRFSENKVMTCSLDRTIRVWDYSVSDDHPERIIRTPYPVWRARHTPFGEGILAMPQRGDNKLHLFDARTDSSDQYDAAAEPVYSFKGHDDSVKEFLWRARGTVNDQMEDNREFQLVSWGNDHKLLLHKIKEKPYEAVGFKKGMRLNRSLQQSRKGSEYISYRDPPLQQVDGELARPPTWENRQTIATHTDATEDEDGNSTAVMSRPATSATSGIISTTVIKWMKGVRFGKSSKGSRLNVRRSLQALSQLPDLPNQRESLSDEIIRVSDMFKNLAFEDIDLKARRAVISMTGPWGSDEKSIFIKLSLSFPREYPNMAPPRFDLSKSPALSDERMGLLEHDLNTIAELHLKQQARCLESVLCYLTGEHTLRQSIAWLNIGEHDLTINNKVDSSSDEEDPLGDFVASESQMLPDDAPGPGTLGGNANVPIPKACGAIWAPNGRLVCFFPPKALPPSMFDKVRSTQLTKSNSDVMLEGLGRLHADAQKPRGSVHPTPDETPDDSDYDSSSSSSSSSSGSSNEIGLFSAALYGRRSWDRSSLKGKPRPGSVEGSHRTSAGPGKSLGPQNPKTIVSIQCHDDILPVKMDLAVEYKVFGDSTEVCSHNSRVAANHGEETTADIWSLLSYVLDKEVPLVSLMFEGHGNGAFVMAKRALVRIQRQSNAIGFAFNNPLEVSCPDVWGQLKWGNHPFSATWLIRRIFNYFQRLADVQMLAVLSCVLADHPFPPKSVPTATDMAWPGQSVPYFPADHLALTSPGPRIALSSSRASSDLQIKLGSHPSSDGLDHVPSTLARTTSDLPIPLSTASTPPTLSRQGSARPSLAATTAAAVSLSVSPEAKSSAIPTAAQPSFASSVWARGFQLSTSPPLTRTHRASTHNNNNQAPGPGEENLISTSLASSGGITWGPITVHGSTSTMRRAFLRSQSRESSGDDDDDDDDDDDGAHEAITPSDVGVKVSLKNGLRFEDEGAGDRPLMDDEIRARARGWRAAYASLLESSGLVVEAVEVRKFNVGEDEEGGTLSHRASQVTVLGAEMKASREGLMLGRCCVRCGLVMPPGAGSRGKCPRCSTRRRGLGCGVCREPVKGLHRSCVNCGHVAHTECFLDLKLGGDEDGGEDLCEVGCGCRCAGFDTLQLEE